MQVTDLIADLQVRNFVGERPWGVADGILRESNLESFNFEQATRDRGNQETSRLVQARNQYTIADIAVLCGPQRVLGNWPMRPLEAIKKGRLNAALFA